MRIRLMVLIAVAYLASAGLAKADAIYTVSFIPIGADIHSPTWSFEVPAIITTDTTITDFLSSRTGLLFAGCPDVISVTISNPQTDGVVDTAVGPCGDEVLEFGVPITSFGAFTTTPDQFGGYQMLTIRSSVATPEPASLLLLGAGIIPLLWVARRKLARPMEYCSARC